MENPRIEIEYDYIVKFEKYKATITVFIPESSNFSDRFGESPINEVYLSDKVYLLGEKLDSYWGDWDAGLKCRKLSDYMTNRRWWFSTDQKLLS